MTLSWAILEKGMYDHARASVEHEPFGRAKSPRRCKEENNLPFVFHFRRPYGPILGVAVGRPFVGRDGGWARLRIRGDGHSLLPFLTGCLLVSRELFRYLGRIRQSRGLCGCGLCGKRAGSGRLGPAVCCRSGRRWRWLGKIVERRGVSWLDGRLILVIQWDSELVVV